jgi:hypothetical protein
MKKGMEKELTDKLTKLNDEWDKNHPDNKKVKAETVVETIECQIRSTFDDNIAKFYGEHTGVIALGYHVDLAKRSYKATYVITLMGIKIS